MSNNDTADDPTVELTVRQPNAVEKAKKMLSGYDLDDDAVARIDLSIHEADAPTPVQEPDPTPDTVAADPADGDGDASYLSEDDRTLTEVQPNNSTHATLCLLDVATEPITGAEAAEAVGMKANSVRSTLSTLYKHRMADRDESSRPFRYEISQYGKARLDEIGRDPQLTETNGSWKDADLSMIREADTEATDE